MAKFYDAIVIGAGHAGAEAAHALAVLKKNTLLLSLSLDAVAFMACNPNVGGTAKGHLVKEIDALGGIMGLAADSATIQSRMLNLGNGAAVHSLRAQVDKAYYHRIIKEKLEKTGGLTLTEGEAVEIIVENGKFKGIKTALGDTVFANALVIATGVYLKSDIIIGNYRRPTGPNGFCRAENLSESLRNLNLDLRRFKTGTPPRVLKSSVDFSQMESQNGDLGLPKFSYMTEGDIKNDMPCHLTYTNNLTHDIILNNLDRSPIYNGLIEGVGPRYCPSIETKVVRFKDKERHQIFIEPEGADTDEMYVQGLSTSLPFDVQEKMLRTIPGLQNAHITRYGYAIEYDCLNPKELTAELGIKKIKGIYAAGQINGSSGYEEAAAQGLIAGINASRYIDGKEGLILKRSEAYIGVLIDDLVTKGTEEPYRMMTSRAEHRLSLRQDNADSRLTPIGRKIGLVDDERYNKFLKREREYADICGLLNKSYSPAAVESVFNDKNEPLPKSGITAKEILKRPKLDYSDLEKLSVEFKDFDSEIKKRAETAIKYEGYLLKEEKSVKELTKLDNFRLSPDIVYENIEGLRLEARQKLDAVKPITLSQASRISGVTPADITVLMIKLKKQN